MVEEGGEAAAPGGTKSALAPANKPRGKAVGGGRDPGNRAYRPLLYLECIFVVLQL